MSARRQILRAGCLCTSGGGISRWAVGLLVALLVTGCGRTASNPGAAERVVVYAAHDQQFSEPILAEFTRRTGIAVDAVYDTEATKTVGLVNRLVAERERPRCDVFWNNEVLNTLRLKKQGLLAACRPAGADDYPAWARDPEGFWFGFAARARVLIVHTGLVPPGERPASIFDLTHERWRGRVGIAKPLFGTTASHVAALAAQLGEEPLRDYLMALKANDVKVLSGNKGCAELVGRGDLAVAFPDTDDALAEVDAGRPVEIIFPDQEAGGCGTLILPNTVMLMSGAPNPSAGVRLIEYLLSAEVEERLAAGAAGQIPLGARAGVRSRVEPAVAPRPMAVGFEAAAEAFEPAARFVEREFLR